MEIMNKNLGCCWTPPPLRTKAQVKKKVVYRTPPSELTLTDWGNTEIFQNIAMAVNKLSIVHILEPIN